MPDTLAARIRAKYPGAYDDLDDARLEASVLNKYPGVYDDIPRATKLPTKPVSAEDFAPAPRNVLADAAIGAAKGVGQTVANLAEMGANLMPGGNAAAFLQPEFRNPLFMRTDEMLAPANEAQQVGKTSEAVAELAGPAVGVARAVPRILRAVGPEALNIARSMATSDTPILTQLRQGAVKKIFGRMIDSAAKPAVSPNAGGRIVKPAVSSAEDEMSSMLRDVQQELGTRPPPAKMTTPPQPDLPPGFTPRTTIPKPKPAKASLPTEKATEAPAAPKRAYFLRPAKEASAASEPVEALGRSVGIEDLPVAWRSRAAPIQGGTPAADAFEAVAKNPRLTNQTRLQFRDALLAMLAQQ